MAEMNCALCANKVVFPVRFIGEDEREIGYDYHLIAACMVLSERLLASHGEDPQITELTRLPVIRLVQVNIKDREFGHFQGDEPCDEAIRDRGENVQAFALKLVHAFKESYDSGQMRSLGKRDWTRLRDEYLQENGQKCWARELLDYCNNMGSGPLTLLWACGSLGILAIQELWEVAMHPDGKPKEKGKTSPTITIDVSHLNREVQYFQ